jgi:outer membrane protein
MLKKIGLGFSILFYSLFYISTVQATNLLEIYHQALVSDPSFQSAISSYMAEEELIPQSRAELLPQINFSADRTWNKINTHQSVENISSSLKERAITHGINLNQSIFNLEAWQKLNIAKYNVKAAAATYNAEVQSLMQRAVSSFFNVLKAREILKYIDAEKQALYSEYQRAEQSFKVGIKTITDVQNAKAAYDTAISKYVTAKNNFDFSKENLRVITGKTYADLDWLKQEFPLNKPNPADIEQWSKMALEHNWALNAAKYNTLAAKASINSAKEGHLPTVNLSTSYNNSYANYGTNYNAEISDGSSFSNLIPEPYRTKGYSASLNLSLPIYSGGLIQSRVRAAIANYQTASAQEEQMRRNVLNMTRQSYLAIINDISKLKADQQAIVSNKSSLEGTQESYKVGIRTIIDVLNAQQSLYEAQSNYAIDRYDYINSMISLKQATGILSEKDLIEINQWLGQLEQNGHKNK